MSHNEFIEKHKLDRKRLIESVRGRDFAVSLSGDCLTAIQKGTLTLKYKGLRFCKNPLDQGIYLRLLQSLKPASIIEIGTSEGGSAVWFRDQCHSIGLATKVVTIDLNPPSIHEQGIECHMGDSLDPEMTFPSRRLSQLPHPWLVIEDSAHTYTACSAVLNYFAERLQIGDYIVVEDGVVSDLPEDRYREYEDGPNRAVGEFLEKHPDTYIIDNYLCDLFGYNATFCPNGFLRRVR